MALNHCNARTNSKVEHLAPMVYCKVFESTALNQRGFCDLDTTLTRGGVNPFPPPPPAGLLI